MNRNLSIRAPARRSLWLTRRSVSRWRRCQTARTLPSRCASASHAPGFQPGENRRQRGQPSEAGCSAALGHGVAAHPDPAQKIAMCERTSTYGSRRTARPRLGVGDKALLWLRAARTEKSVQSRLAPCLASWLLSLSKSPLRNVVRVSQLNRL